MLGYVLTNRKVWAHDHRLFRLWLFLLSVPDLAARLPGAEPAHELSSRGAVFHHPWIFAALADLFIGGFLTDHFIARGYDPTKVRKTVIVAGMMAGLAVFGITVTTDPFWALVFITIALSGLAAAAPVASSVVSLIAPRGGTATVGGFANLINNLMGVAAPVSRALSSTSPILFPALFWSRAGTFGRHLLLCRPVGPHRTHSGPCSEADAALLPGAARR